MDIRLKIHGRDFHSYIQSTFAIQARRSRASIGMIASVAFAACSESTAPLVCDPGAPGPSLAVAKQDSLEPVPTNRRTIDDIWADIARQVPGGWGGFFLENGQPTVFLVQPGRQDEALAALYDAGVGEPFDVREADVRRGRWDFAQLHDWRRYIDQVVGRPDGVVSSDLDEARNRIAYGVRDNEAANAFSSLLDSANLPCELVLIEVQGVVSGHRSISW